MFFGAARKHQPSNIFEVLPHVRLNEDTGKIRCSKCGTDIVTSPNPQRDLELTLRQQKAFDEFSNLHRHYSE
jgi:hypothetical protein